MSKESGNIEDLFGKAFRNAEETPPDSLWDNLESSLNEEKIDSIYKKTFSKAVEKPSGKVWKKISLALFIRGFFRFNPKTINAYYVGIASIIGLVALNTGNDNIESTLPEPPKFAEIEKALDKQEAIITQNSQTVNQEKIVEKETAKSIVAVDTTVLDSKPVVEIPVKENAVQSVEEIAFYNNLKSSTFTSLKEVCQNTEFDVELKGLPKDYIIEWDFGKKDVKTTFVYENKASAIFAKEGEQEYIATVKFGEYSYDLKSTVIVKAATKPVIDGPDLVCEGSTVRFKIDAKHDKNIEYFWESFEGNHLKDANRYTDLTAEIPGLDTIYAVKIDNVTKCKTEGFATFKVTPAPKADFTWAPMGEGEFEFKYNGIQEKGTSYTWLIEGDKENGSVVEYRSDSKASSPVTLTVTNKRGCSNVISHPVSFNKYIIVVPNVFQVQNEFGHEGLKPRANTKLKSYKIEIFDLSSSKIWESTLLEDGMPAEAWDGTDNGEPVISGKYLWRITAEFTDGIIWKGIRNSYGECKPEGVVTVKN